VLLRTKTKTDLSLLYLAAVLSVSSCSQPAAPTLSPLSQLDYDFVRPTDYRLEKISSRLRLAAYAEGYSLPPGLTPLIIKEAKPTAFSLASGEIIISDGLLTQVVDEGQLAAVIAHEYSHKLLKHFNNLQSSKMINMTIEPELEFAADELSVKLLKQAGYPEIEALKALRTLHRRIRSEVSSEWNALLTRREENLAALIQN
jgi:Zn-dependent protease with chaperone function